MIRTPSNFSTHEGNAEVRYVEVTEILPAPESSADLDPYQPVQVKCLQFQTYTAASTGVIATANADVTIYTAKAHKKHGTRGNSIDVTFAIDGGITDPCEATFDESSDALQIKVKASTVTWAQVAEEVATVLDGAFALDASDTAAQVSGSIGSATGTTSGGANGGYTTYGDAFGIGGPETKDSVEVGDKLWITWRKDANRWDIITGGPGGSGSTFRLARVVVEIPAATGNLLADWGEADAAASLLDDSSGAEEDPDNPVDVVNRWDISFPVDAQIKIDVSKTPAQVDNGTCNPFVDWAAT